MDKAVGLVILGDMVAAIALVTMLVAGETTTYPERLRTVLGTVHGLLVLAGLNYAILTLDPLPTVWTVLLYGADLFGVALVAVVLALVFPERAPGESSWPLWRTTFAPLAYTAVWGALGALTFHRGWSGVQDVALGSLAFLGVHYTLLTGGVFASLLVRPPSMAPAALMGLGERLESLAGMFFQVLILALFVQGGLAIASHHERLFGHGVLGPIVSGTLWLVGLVQGVRDAWGVFAREDAPV